MSIALPFSRPDSSKLTCHRGSIVEHSRYTVMFLQKVETETQNLSQLVTDAVQFMVGHLRTQSQESKSAQEDTKTAIQSEIDVVSSIYRLSKPSTFLSLSRTKRGI